MASKYSPTDSPISKRRKQSNPLKKQTCIIHHKTTTDTNFTWLNNLKEPGERLKSLKRIAGLRQCESIELSQRMDEECNILKSIDTISEEHGYHRACYQRFVRNAERLKKIKKKAVK